LDDNDAREMAFGEVGGVLLRTIEQVTPDPLTEYSEITANSQGQVIYSAANYLIPIFFGFKK